MHVCMCAPLCALHVRHVHAPGKPPSRETYPQYDSKQHSEVAMQIPVPRTHTAVTAHLNLYWLALRVGYAHSAQVYSDFNANACCSEKHEVPSILNSRSCSFEVVLIVRSHILQRYKRDYYIFL